MMGCFLERLKEWSPLIIAIPGVIAAIGLFFNWWAIRESRKTRELQIFYTVFKDIKQLEEKQPDYQTAEQQQAWNSLFFNTLEFFSFLINQKMVSDKRVAEFFGDSIKAWYEELFLKKLPKEQVDDPDDYTEFKTLYKKSTKRKHKG